MVMDREGTRSRRSLLLVSTDVDGSSTPEELASSFATGLELTLPSIVSSISPNAIDGISLQVDKTTGELLATVSLLPGSLSGPELQAATATAAAAAETGLFEVPMVRSGPTGTFNITDYIAVNAVTSNAPKSTTSSVSVTTIAASVFGGVLLLALAIVASVSSCRQRSPAATTVAQKHPPEVVQQQQQLAAKKALLKQQLEEASAATAAIAVVAPVLVHTLESASSM